MPKAVDLATVKINDSSTTRTGKISFCFTSTFTVMTVEDWEPTIKPVGPLWLPASLNINLLAA